MRTTHRIASLSILLLGGSSHAAITVTQQTLTLDFAAPTTPASPGTYISTIDPPVTDLGPCVVDDFRYARITSSWDANSINFRTDAISSRTVISGDASGSGFGNGSPLAAIALAVVRFTVDEPSQVIADFQRVTFTQGSAGPAYRLTNLTTGIDLTNTNNPADADNPPQFFTLQPGNVYEWQLCSLTNLVPTSTGGLAQGSLMASWSSSLAIVPSPGCFALGSVACGFALRRRR